jgi:hypothetical protein
MRSAGPAQMVDIAGFSLGRLIKMVFIKIQKEVFLIYQRMLTQIVGIKFALPINA